MSKVVTSPVKRFSGTVTLSDPLTYPQIIAFVDALDAVKALEKPNDISVKNAALPGILKCVEKWELANFPDPVTVETFPASLQSGRLIDFLMKEITAVYMDDETVPLAG